MDSAVDCIGVVVSVECELFLQVEQRRYLHGFLDAYAWTYLASASTALEWDLKGKFPV